MIDNTHDKQTTISTSTQQSRKQQLNTYSRKYNERQALQIITSLVNKYKNCHKLSKKIKREYSYIHPDDIPCSPEIEQIIRNKKIKIEYDE